MGYFRIRKKSRELWLTSDPWDVKDAKEIDNFLNKRM